MNPIVIYSAEYSYGSSEYIQIMFKWKEGFFSNKYTFWGILENDELSFIMDKYNILGINPRTIYVKDVPGESISKEDTLEELREWFANERGLQHVRFVSGSLKDIGDLEIGDFFKGVDLVDGSPSIPYKIIRTISTESRGGTKLITGVNENNDEWSFSVSNTELSNPYCYTESKYIESSTIDKEKETKKHRI